MMSPADERALRDDIVERRLRAAAHAAEKQAEMLADMERLGSDALREIERLRLALKECMDHPHEAYGIAYKALYGPRSSKR